MSEKKPNLVELGQKIVNIDLIEIKDKMPAANTEYLDAYIESLTSYVDEAIANDLDVDVIESKAKEIKTTFENFIDFRKSFTAPFNGIVKEFTSREALIEAQRDRLKKQKEKMLETTYKEAEEAIRAELQRLQSENDNIVPDMTVFDSFIETQRKVKGMLPNDKGILGKASLEKIEKEFEKHVAPIREMKALEELKAKEQKQFEMYLDNVNTSSDNINELEASIITLEKFKSQIADGELYASVTDQCIRSVDNKIGLAKGSINALKALEAQRKAEEEAKQATAKVEELQDIDDEIITEVKKAKDGIDFIIADKELLNSLLKRLKVLWSKCVYAETKQNVTDFTNEVKSYIEKLNESVESGSDEAKEMVEVGFIISDSIDKARLVKQFMLDNSVNFKSI